MRPLILDLARHFGGAEVRVLQLMQAFQHMDGQVACFKQSPLAERVSAAGCQAVEIGGDKVNPRTASALRKTIQSGGFDIIDAHNVQSYFWAYLATRGMVNCPALVATVHSSTRIENQGGLKAQFYESITRLAVPRFDQVVTVSKFISSELTSYGIPEDHISRIPNGIKFIRAESKEGLDVRCEFGIDPSDRVIGTVGRLEPAKGMDILIAAMARLKVKWPRIKCLIVGDGRLSAFLKDHTKERGLEKDIIFTGFRNDIPRLLEAFDLFVLSSRTEGIPIALLEACSASLPVVATRVGGVPEIICDGQNGLLVDPEDINELANAMDALLSDPPLASRLGHHAGCGVAARYTLDSMIDGTRQAYQTAMEHRKARSE